LPPPAAAASAAAVTTAAVLALTQELRLCCHPCHILLGVMMQPTSLAIDTLQQHNTQHNTPNKALGTQRTGNTLILH
jgi:hypothetical protein